MHLSPQRVTPLGVVWRACFLACSWTWCIGMWFPVYMIRDWGWPGWAAFLVPNALGAALVGFIHSARSSPRQVAANLTAMRAFSVITILFHIAWLVALFASLAAGAFVHQGWVGATLAVACVIAGFLASGSRRWAAASIAVYLISITAWAATSFTSQSLRMPLESGTEPPATLWYALPMLAIGFFLCPHLDLTFHRTRQEAPARAGTLAFALGFGVLFPLLMLYTLYYAGGFVHGTWSLYLILHMGFQAAFTIAAHTRELRHQGLARWPSRSAARRALFILASIAMLAAAILPWMPAYAADKPAFRLAYEIAMSSYGLVFPAYVWIVMIPRRVDRRAAVFACACATLLAAPFVWVGYVEQHHVWLLLAVAIVLFAPVAMRAVFGDQWAA